MIVGGVPAHRRDTHSIAEFTLDHPLPFLDMEHPTTRRALEHALSGDLAALGVKNLDIPDVRSEHRRVTRTIATWAYLAHGASPSLPRPMPFFSAQVQGQAGPPQETRLGLYLRPIGC